MRKRALYTAQDERGLSILRRVLNGTNWTFAQHVPLRLAFDRELDDLSVAERRRYAEGSFPFVLYPGEGVGHEPVLAIELFPDVVTERAATEAIVTARFCHQAELPLLRLRTHALKPLEQASLFEWVVSRIVTWGQEGEQRMRDAEQRMRDALDEQPDLPREAIEDVVGDFDPHFWFDIEHPFPGLAIIAKRLRSRFGIRVVPHHFGYEDAGDGAPYELDFPRADGGSERTLIGEYVTRTVHAVVRQRVGENARALAECEGSARFATAHLIAPPERANEVLDAAYAANHPGDLWGVALARLEVFDFTWPTGVMPSEVVRDIALYHAMAATERWAEAHLPVLAANSGAVQP